ncbi:MAG: PAS domain S-box protein [Ktedonobacteraceae bacterium]|nr:PAS domain S-box protein [Ktedonobacteraceae bacterium]
MILLVALGWGAGPSIVATLVGACSLMFFVFPPSFSFALEQAGAGADVLLYLVVGLTIAIVTSQTQRARLAAQALSQRLETIIEVLPDRLVIYDRQGRPTHFNRLAREIVPLEQQHLSLSQVLDHLDVRGANSEHLPLNEMPLARALRGEQVSGVELRYFPGGGEAERVVSVSAVPLRSAGHGAVEGAITITHDLTALRMAERDATERAIELEAIFEALPEALYVYDQMGHTVRMNTTGRLLLRRTSRPGISQPLEQVRSADAQRQQLSDDQLPTARILSGEVLAAANAAKVTFPSLEGEDILTSVTGAPLRDRDGQITGAVAIYRDMTEYWRVEEAQSLLAEVSKVLSSTLDYQETLANISRLIVPRLADWFSVDLVDTKGHFELIEVGHKDPAQVQWARALREKYPINPDASTGTPEVLRSGQAELYPEITDEMLVAGARSEEELTILRQLGFTSAMSVPLIARGRTIGVVSFVATASGKRYDERDLALAEEVGRRAGVALDNARLFREVKQARDQLDIILQGVADGIVVYNKEGQIIYANDAAGQLTGYASGSAMMEASPLAIVAKYEIIDEQGQPFPHARLAHRRVFEGELEAQATIGYRDTVTDQPMRWSLVKSRPVFDEHGEVAVVITIIRDITDRVQTERRKDEFISIASHELKTPVTSLKGFTTVLQRRLAKQGDEQGLHYLARMDTQLIRLTKLINDLLDVSKMQSGKLAFDVEPFDLDGLLQETVETVQAATSTHHLLREGSTSGHILGDRDRLAQVFINLLTNAIKYSPHADKVVLQLSRDENQAIVRVQDFGIGIDPSYHQKIFERFYQVTDPEERTYPGLGMGL